MYFDISDDKKLLVQSDLQHRHSLKELYLYNFLNFLFCAPSIPPGLIILNLIFDLLILPTILLNKLMQLYYE